MDYPALYPLRIAFKHRSVAYVREVVTGAGWERFCETVEVSTDGGVRLVEVPRRNDLKSPKTLLGVSEIWFHRFGRGYATIRIDAQGHAMVEPGAPWGGNASRHFHRTPHYHKEWVPGDLFEAYTKKYVPQAVPYDDDGNPHTGPMNDEIAKLVHIPM